MAGRLRKFKGAAWAAIFISVLLLLGIAAGCSSNGNSNPYGGGGGGGGGTPGANDVWIQGMAFDPGTRTVAVGTTITWTNKDAVAHTVTSGTPGVPSGVFNSGNLAPGATYTFHFTTAGTFPYFCNIHHSMTGVVTVQ